MNVRVLTTCHTQYTRWFKYDWDWCCQIYTQVVPVIFEPPCTWDSGICIFLFNRTTLQVFVTYLTGALYVHRLWFYKHQHDNRGCSKLFAACQRWWCQWRFWFVPSVLGYTHTLSLETVHTIFEWNCQMAGVSQIWCRIAAGQLYPDNHFE